MKTSDILTRRRPRLHSQDPGSPTSSLALEGPGAWSEGSEDQTHVFSWPFGPSEAKLHSDLKFPSPLPLRALISLPPVLGERTQTTRFLVSAFLKGEPLQPLSLVLPGMKLPGLGSGALCFGVDILVSVCGQRWVCLPLPSKPPAPLSWMRGLLGWVVATGLGLNCRSHLDWRGGGRPRVGKEEMMSKKPQALHPPSPTSCSCPAPPHSSQAGWG